MDYNMPRPRKESSVPVPKTFTCLSADDEIVQVSSQLVYPVCERWNPGCTGLPAYLPAITVCRGY